MLTLLTAGVSLSSKVMTPAGCCHLGCECGQQISVRELQARQDLHRATPVSLLTVRARARRVSKTQCLHFIIRHDGVACCLEVTGGKATYCRSCLWLRSVSFDCDAVAHLRGRERHECALLCFADDPASPVPAVSIKVVFR